MLSRYTERHNVDEWASKPTFSEPRLSTGSLRSIGTVLNADKMCCWRLLSTTTITQFVLQVHTLWSKKCHPVIFWITQSKWTDFSSFWYTEFVDTGYTSAAVTASATLLPVDFSARFDKNKVGITEFSYRNRDLMDLLKEECLCRR